MTNKENDHAEELIDVLKQILEVVNEDPYDIIKQLTKKLDDLTKRIESLENKAKENNSLEDLKKQIEDIQPYNPYQPYSPNPPPFAPYNPWRVASGNHCSVCGRQGGLTGIDGYACNNFNCPNTSTHSFGSTTWTSSPALKLDVVAGEDGKISFSTKNCDNSCSCGQNTTCQCNK